MTRCLIRPGRRTTLSLRQGDIFGLIADDMPASAMAQEDITPGTTTPKLVINRRTSSDSATAERVRVSIFNKIRRDAFCLKDFPAWCRSKRYVAAMCTGQHGAGHRRRDGHAPAEWRTAVCRGNTARREDRRTTDATAAQKVKIVNYRARDAADAGTPQAKALTRALAPDVYGETCFSTATATNFRTQPASLNRSFAALRDRLCRTRAPRRGRRPSLGRQDDR